MLGKVLGDYAGKGIVYVVSIGFVGLLTLTYSAFSNTADREMVNVAEDFIESANQGQDLVSLAENPKGYRSIKEEMGMYQSFYRDRLGRCELTGERIIEDGNPNGMNVSTGDLVRQGLFGLRCEGAEEAQLLIRAELSPGFFFSSGHVTRFQFHAACEGEECE